MTVQEAIEFTAHARGKWHPLDKDLSNFDHKIPDGLVEELKSDPTAFANYYAWEFKADVFYKDNSFHAAIMRYHAFADLLSAPTIKDLMVLCSERFGYD